MKCSIIAVHGLGGNWLKTWRADDGAIWLRDRVPQLLAEKKIQARVLSYGYNADVIFTNTINTIDIVAGDLLSQVYSVRTTDEQKKAPIIFVAHSLGGLVVKAVSCVQCYLDTSVSCTKYLPGNQQGLDREHALSKHRR